MHSHTHTCTHTHNMHTHTHIHTHAHTQHAHCVLTCTHRQPELVGGTLPQGNDSEGSDADSDADSDVSLEHVAVQSKPQWDCESVLSTYSNYCNHPARITEPPSLKGAREVGSTAASITEHTASLFGVSSM